MVKHLARVHRLAKAVPKKIEDLAKILVSLQMIEAEKTNDATMQRARKFTEKIPPMQKMFDQTKKVLKVLKKAEDREELRTEVKLLEELIKRNLVPHDQVDAANTRLALVKKGIKRKDDLIGMYKRRMERKFKKAIGNRLDDAFIDDHKKRDELGGFFEVYFWNEWF